LKELVEKHGAKKWSLISGMMGGRMGKQCRERLKILFFFPFLITIFYISI